jgi:hypothetical protein
MNWLTEQQIKQAFQQAEGYEPDPDIVNRVRQVCLESIRSNAKRNRSTQTLTGIGTAVAVMMLAWGSFALVSLQPPQTISSTPETFRQEHHPLSVPSEVSRHTLPKTNPAAYPAKPASVQERSARPEPAVSEKTADLQATAKQFLRQVVGDRHLGEYHFTQLVSRETGKQEIRFARTQGISPTTESVIAVELDQTGHVIRLTANNDPVTFKRIAEAHRLRDPEWLQEMLAGRLQLFYRQSSKTPEYVMPVLADINAHTGRLAGKADFTSYRYDHPKRMEITPEALPFSGESPKQIGDLLAEETGIETSGLLFAGEESGAGGKAYVWRNEQGTTVRVETAGDGRITAFQLQESGQERQERQIKVTKNFASEIAMHFLGKHLPRKISQISLCRVNELAEGTILEFEFMPAVENIRILDMVYRVKVDLTDGKIVGFTGDFAAVPDHLPRLDKVMEKSRMATEFLKLYPPQLIAMPADHPLQGDPSFVYRLQGLPDRELHFDALTGKSIQR